ncbi:MAG: nucleotidyl transferase AbiEii/AbiGii toxin family protein, partial [Anaeroplasmataceae bacterium]|nr:nucleotidyl transferase AbiEii/AbiGii toxin family protein [Anaeroplasmataceae bacterium]
MILHQDKEIFKTAINLASSYFNTSTAIVEKDYYITLVLSLLAKQIPDLIFKGGTSLSKCYQIIHRFSEDIDITMDHRDLSTSKRRNLKYTILEICDSIGVHLIN